MDRTGAENEAENEVARRRRVFSEKFAANLDIVVLARLPLDRNAAFMEEVDPSQIHLAVMSNMTCGELWEMWFYSHALRTDDDRFFCMCSSGDFESVFKHATIVQKLAVLAKDIVSSREEFEVLQKFVTYRDDRDEGYTEDMSERGIWNFGSVLGLLDPTNTPKAMTNLSQTLRQRLRNHVFPRFVHDDLEDRDDGDLDDVRVDHEALLKDMKMDKDMSQDLPRLLWGLRKIVSYSTTVGPPPAHVGPPPGRCFYCIVPTREGLHSTLGGHPVVVPSGRDWFRNTWPYLPDEVWQVACDATTRGSYKIPIQIESENRAIVVFVFDSCDQAKLVGLFLDGLFSASASGNI